MFPIMLAKSVEPETKGACGHNLENNACRNVQMLNRMREYNYAQGCNYVIYEGWNFNSGNYLFTTDTK